MSPSTRHRLGRVLWLIVAAIVLHAPAALALPLPYAVDNDYANGTFTDDAFAADITQPNAMFVGKKVLRVNNEILVAALVKYPNGNQTNGMWNLGLVRYNASGTERLTWSNPPALYAHYQDEYIVFPNSATGLIRNVQDMRVLGERIYVLVDEQYTPTSPISISRVYVFGTDGRFITAVIPFSANGLAVADTPNTAGGLATYTDLVANKHYLVVTATRFLGGTQHGRPVFTRYDIVDVGGLGAAMPMVELNTSACWNPAWECHVRAIEANALYSPKFYVAFAYRPNASNENWNVAVSRIDSNGVGDGSWDPNNMSWNISDGGNGSDWPMGLEVRTPPSQGAFRDEIYVVSESARNCQPGIGVLRLDHDGARVASRLLGGDTSTGSACMGNSRRFDKPQAIVASATNTHTLDARLAIVGYTGVSFVVGPPTNATLTVLDASLQTEGILDVRSPVSSTSNFGTRFPALFGVVSDGNGAFTATGSLAYGAYNETPANLHNKRTVTTVRFAPDVLIFSDDFD